jgi:2-dehydropantoate 2-reductase
MDSHAVPLLVVGTGAMASLFAARLSASGVKVRMLGTWKEGIQELNAHGVRLVDEQGNRFAYPVEATDDPDSCQGSQFAIVLVKSYQTALAAQKLAACLSGKGIALTLQNGINNYQTLADALGKGRVATGVTTAGATLISPGIVRVGGTGAVSLRKDTKLQPLISIFSQAGYKIEIVVDTEGLIWGKLVINAAINPLTAILRVPNGELVSNPFARNIMNLVAIEAAEVAKALGINLPYTDAVSEVESVAQRTASNYSSMYKDVMRGSQTEIEAINGAIVQAGELADIPVNYNRLVWLMVKALSTEHSI